MYIVFLSFTFSPMSHIQCFHHSAAWSAGGFSLILLLAIWGPVWRCFDVLQSSPFQGKEQTPPRTSPNSPPTSADYLTHKTIVRTHLPHRPPDPELTSFAGFSPGPLLSIFHSSTWCLTGLKLCSVNQVQGSFFVCYKVEENATRGTGVRQRTMQVHSLSLFEEWMKQSADFFNFMSCLENYGALEGIWRRLYYTCI